MTPDEKRVVLAVFEGLCTLDRNTLNTFLGSETIRNMYSLYNRLRYEGYCKRHGIKYEDMTDLDFIEAYEEEVCSNFRLGL